jgi:hypothetical protein
MDSPQNGTLPPRAPVATPPRRSRWERWQRSTISQHYLTPAGAAAGFTVVKVTPSMRPAFFDLVQLLLARARLETQLVGVLEQQDPATTAALQESLAAWKAWRRYTVQLARAFERLAQGRQATLPPLPCALQAFAAALDEDEEATA